MGKQAQEALAKAREEHRRSAELVRVKATETWQAEAARDAARTSREKMEVDSGRMASETKYVEANIARLQEQNRKLMQDQVRTRNDCSVLVQRSLKNNVDEFLKANPDLAPSGSTQLDNRDNEVNIRLGLAGFATKLSRAG